MPRTETTKGHLIFPISSEMRSEGLLEGKGLGWKNTDRETGTSEKERRRKIM